MKIQPSQFLRFVCVAVVAGVFVLAGVGKIWMADADTGGNMVARYLNSPQAVKAVGFAEIGLAMWMLSFHLPRLSASVAAGVLVVFSILIYSEIQRDKPLPCGCLPTTPGMDNPHEIRSGLWISLTRNGFLTGLTIVSIVLAPPANRRDA